MSGHTEYDDVFDATTVNIAAGGCTTPYPYVGDVPPLTPYIPPYSAPAGWGTTTTLKLSEPTKLTVYIIWAVPPNFPDKPFALSVWDADTRDVDEDGFLADLAVQEEAYGARFVRVTKTTINYDALVAAFGEVEI